MEALKGCVTPIFDVNERGEAELLGSAVLVEVIGYIFLCTAKHVIDKNAESTLYIDAPSGLEILVGDFYTSEVAQDIAVLKLSPEQVELLQKYSPLPTHQIANQSQAEICKYVEFMGFPATKNRKTFQQNKIRRLLQSNGCAVVEVSPAKVRVSFNRKRNVDTKSRQRVTAPDPHGMSGGAMFGVPVTDATIKGNPQPKLIGISTEWWPNLNEVFGANIALAMAIIRDAYGVILPARLNPSNIQTTTSITRSPPSSE
jgi:hypothetical protein